MKLLELLPNQRIVVQLLWGEQKIEFNSDVIDNDGVLVYVTPYVHNGRELELNVTFDKGVVCNIFTDDPVTKQRISWKGIELTTINRNNSNVYGLKARSYNAVSNIDDRRLHERIEVHIDGRLIDEQDGDIGVIIHDISDTGLSLHVPEKFVPKSQQIGVTFTDSIGEVIYNIKLSCAISRESKSEGYNVIGCRLLGNNKDYQIYGLLKRLRTKAGYKKNNAENDEQKADDIQKPESDEQLENEQPENELLENEQLENEQQE